MKCKKLLIAVALALTMAAAPLTASAATNFGLNWNYNPGYTYPGSAGIFKSNYTGGTLEMFYTPNTNDTVLCQYCWNTWGETHYSDYRGWNRTKANANNSLLLTGVNGNLKQHYHRHWNGAWTWDQYWIWATDDRIQRDGSGPALYSVSNSSNTTGNWINGMATLSIHAKDQGIAMSFGQSEPNGSGSGINHFELGINAFTPQWYGQQIGISESGGDWWSTGTTLEGNYNPIFRVVDNVGIASGWCGVSVDAQRVRIDRTPPSLSLALENTGWCRSTFMNATFSDVKPGVNETSGFGTWYQLSGPTASQVSHGHVPIVQNGTYTYRMLDKAGNYGDATIVISNIDNLQPTATVTQPTTVDMTNRTAVVTLTPFDRVDATGANGKSGIASVTLPDGTVVPCTDNQQVTYAVSENKTYRFVVTDKAGNATNIDVPITVFDTTPPKITHVFNTPDGVPSGWTNDWTNQDVTVTIYAADVEVPNAYTSGVKGIDDGSGKVIGVPVTGTAETYGQITVTHNGNFSVTAVDNFDNRSAESNFAISNIDKVLPEVEFTEDVRYEEGKAIIYLTAKDNESGVSHIILPDGKRIDNPYPDDKTIPLSHTATISTNGVHRFVIADRAGNTVTKTFTYDDLRHDYYVDKMSITMPNGDPTSLPIFDSDFKLNVTWGNREGTGKNVPIEVYAITTSGQRMILAQDTINMRKGSTYDKTYTLNVGKLAESYELYAEIDPLHRSTDLTPDDNIKSIALPEATRKDYVLALNEPSLWYSPGQRVEIPLAVTGTVLGDARHITVDFKLDNKLLKRTYVEVGRYSPYVETVLTPTIPASTSTGKHNVEIVINEQYMSEESNQANNVWKKDVTVQPADLRLNFNTTTVVDGDIYSYPAGTSNYTINIAAVNANETIKSITTLGKTTEPNVNKVPVDLTLELQQSQDFRVVVESACKQYTKTYDVKVVRLNDNLDAEVWCAIDGTKYMGEKDAAGNYSIVLPTGATTSTFNVKMVDTYAKVVTVDSTPVGKNSYANPLALAADSQQTISVTVSAQDTTKQLTFTVLVSNQNSQPTLRITNKDEVRNAMYSLGGILRDGNFTAYGNSITNVDLARRTGRTSGVILELEVKDRNPEQYLKGYIEISGIKYPVHWNTFDGPTSAQTNTITNGYIYIDRTALRADSAVSVFNVKVEDFKSSSEAELPISSATDSVQFGVDVTGPAISAKSDDIAKTVTASATDSLSGLKEMTYRVSTDKGATWTESSPFPGTVVVAQSGNVYVEVTASDNARNISTVQLIMSINGPETEVDGGVFRTTTRVADFIYIGVRKNNSDTVDQKILDTFK